MRFILTSAFVVLSLIHLSGQSNTETETASTKTSPGNVVVITGVRFSYTLVQAWIDDFNKVHPDIQVVIESRGSSDPAAYDVLVETLRPTSGIATTREYLNVGRYAILPVANARSQFARAYSKKGLTKELIRQLYFHNLFADEEKQEVVKVPYTVYTRLQRAGVPSVFAAYFGLEQKDINGKAIAGSDEHLMKALLRDSTGITYLPLPFIFDRATRKPVDGLLVLPVDIDGNGKVKDEEIFYQNVDDVIAKLESIDGKKVNNIPVAYLHLSIEKEKASAEAITFFTWVSENGDRYLHEFGYLGRGPTEIYNEKFGKLPDNGLTDGQK